jgi:hypothetical protein
MKVFLRYEDNDDESTHKTLKITLPKSWISGPTSRLLTQFVESYNAGKEGDINPLVLDQLHLALRSSSSTSASASAGVEGDEKQLLHDLPSDGIVSELISDRQEVYICHGAARTVSDIKLHQQAILDKKKEEERKLAKCVHFGCNQRFSKDDPYRPPCKFHTGPPVFHETVKFWSCCPNKKAYDWDGFQCLPYCQEGTCTDIQDDDNIGQKQFLGGCDIREKLNNGPKLRSIDDFNASAAAGGSVGAPILDRLRDVLCEMGIENELYDQVLDGIKKDVVEKKKLDVDDGRVLDESVMILGSKMKNALKAIAVEQLRIK